MYTLTVNTRKTTRSLAILPHLKTSIEHLVFLRVFCSFPEEVNAVFVGRFSGLHVDG